jgi:hypothetical protein
MLLDRLDLLDSDRQAASTIDFDGGRLGRRSGIPPPVDRAI